MKQHDSVHTAALVRIPGFYRRWELPEILKNQRAYRIENAGSHQDGTPLVAIYADTAAVSLDGLPSAPNKNAETVSGPSGTMSLRPE